MSSDRTAVDRECDGSGTCPATEHIPGCFRSPPESLDGFAWSPEPLKWCDGTPHSPTAIPPLPVHDWRYDGDDPYIVCHRCGRIQESRTGRVILPGRSAL